MPATGHRVCAVQVPSESPNYVCLEIRLVFHMEGHLLVDSLGAMDGLEKASGLGNCSCCNSRPAGPDPSDLWRGRSEESDEGCGKCASQNGG